MFYSFVSVGFFAVKFQVRSIAKSMNSNSCMYASYKYLQMFANECNYLYQQKTALKKPQACISFITVYLCRSMPVYMGFILLLQICQLPVITCLIYKCRWVVRITWFVFAVHIKLAGMRGYPNIKHQIFHCL